MSKPSNLKPYRFLNLLGIPSYPWESIGIDFVGPLPESRNRDGQYDSITVVICLLTGMVHLVPSRINYNATQLAELVFENIYKIHGLPKNIISDRDVLFTSTFWSRLHRLIGTKLRMSSAYHPQSDGSTERANRTVTQMLRQGIQPDQKDWVSKLPAIEFAINSARSESTGYAPFFLNFGRMPRSMIWESASRDEYPSVRDFALQKKMALMAAHDSIIAARVKQTRDANRKRQDVPFVQGDLVYVSSKNISFPKGRALKLLPKFIGPYKIMRDHGNCSFQLDLPAQLKRRGVHNVYHSSLLRVHVPNDNRLFPGRLDTQLGLDEDDEEWAVNRILSHNGSGTDATFEILWKSGDVTWLPYYQVTHLQALTDYLGLLGVTKVARLPKGRGQPPLDDPQVFVASITGIADSPTFPFFHSCSSFFRSLPFVLKTTLRSFSSTVLSSLQPPFTSPTIDLEYSSVMPSHRGIHHPSFLRLSPTHYLIRDPSGDSSNSTIHVGQIADFLNFDERFREHGNISSFQSIPLGYLDFAHLWNANAPRGDPRRLCSFSYEDGSDYPIISLSDHPVDVEDFFITPEQVGLRRPDNHRHHNGRSDSVHYENRRYATPYPEEIALELASTLVDQQRLSRSAFETRRARLLEQLENRNAQTPHQGHHQVRRWEQRQARRQNNPSSATMPRGSSSRQTRSSLSRLDFRKGSRKRPTSPPPSSTPDASSSSLTTESSPLITPSSKAVPHEAQDAVMQEPPSFSNNESSAGSTG